MQKIRMITHRKKGFLKGNRLITIQRQVKQIAKGLKCLQMKPYNGK